MGENTTFTFLMLCFISFFPSFYSFRDIFLCFLSLKLSVFLLLSSPFSYSLQFISFSHVFSNVFPPLVFSLWIWIFMRIVVSICFRYKRHFPPPVLCVCFSAFLFFCFFLVSPLWVKPRQEILIMRQSLYWWSTNLFKQCVRMGKHTVLNAYFVFLKRCNTSCIKVNHAVTKHPFYIGVLISILKTYLLIIIRYKHTTMWSIPSSSLLLFKIIHATGHSIETRGPCTLCSVS